MGNQILPILFCPLPSYLSPVSTSLHLHFSVQLLAIIISSLNCCNNLPTDAPASTLASFQSQPHTAPERSDKTLQVLLTSYSISFQWCPITLAIKYKMLDTASTAPDVLSSASLFGLTASYSASQAPILAFPWSLNAPCLFSLNLHTCRSFISPHTHSFPSTQVSTWDSSKELFLDFSIQIKSPSYFRGTCLFSFVSVIVICDSKVTHEIYLLNACIPIELRAWTAVILLIG